MAEHDVFPGSASATMSVSEGGSSISSSVGGGVASSIMNTALGGTILQTAGDVQTWMNAGTHHYENSTGTVRFTLNGTENAISMIAAHLGITMNSLADKLCAGSADHTVEVCVRATAKQVILTVGPIDCIFDGNDSSISLMINNTFGVKFIGGAITFIFNAGGGPCVNMSALADFIKALKDLNFDSILPGIGDFLDPIMECP